MRRRQPKQAQPRTRRLRKQPKMRRVQSATAISMPKASVPRTAAKRRRRNRRRLHLPTVLLRRFIFSARWISLSLLALTMYALVLTGLDLHFYLTFIPVEGVVSIPPAEIVEASGLAGAHIFAADPNEAAAHIIELPGVISATVTLNWPNRVLVQIKEDSPVAIWQEGNTQYWITANGRLLPARVDTLGLLIIESELPAIPSPELSDPATDEETERVSTPTLAFIPLDVLNGALQLRNLQPTITKLYYRPLGGLSYEDDRGWRAYFGTGSDMHQKLIIYETIVDDLLTRELVPAYISVSNQEKPYYMAR